MDNTEQLTNFFPVGFSLGVEVPSRPMHDLCNLRRFTEAIDNPPVGVTCLPDTRKGSELEMIDIGNEHNSSSTNYKTHGKTTCNYESDCGPTCKRQKTTCTQSLDNNLNSTYTNCSSHENITSSLPSTSGLNANNNVANVNQTDEIQIMNQATSASNNHYCTLIEMFPDIDRNYLMSICNLESDLHSIINIILDDGYPKQPVPDLVEEVIVEDTATTSGECNDHCITKTDDDNDLCQENTQLQFLKMVLPDADPEFLATKSLLPGDDLRTFIDEALEKKDYPKLSVTIKTEEDTSLFTSAFDMEEFLKLYPEPFTFFMDDQRKCIFSEHALSFLKKRFRNHALKTIYHTYQDCQYNLARSSESLENLPFTRVTKRGIASVYTPTEVNVPFLKEACFVEHKTAIKTYLDNKIEEKQTRFNQAKEKCELIECGCCYDEALFEDCATCNEGDIFCKNCIIKSAEVRIGDGHTTFPCLKECGSSFSLNLLQNLLNANIFSRLIKRVQLAEVEAAGIEGLEVCPFCEFATIPPPESNIFTCFNPDCLKESCRKCHKVSHIPQRCEEVENDDQARARKFIEDEMTKALVRECYKCKKSFIKTEGCNKMTCTCGAKMCYICRQPIFDYTHFNGPGGENNKKCPLYSSDKVLHEEAVKVMASKALKTLKSANPEFTLKHDPTTLLPKSNVVNRPLPPGVHENAEELIQQLQNGAEAVNNPIAVQQNQGNNPIAIQQNQGPIVALRHHHRIDVVVDNIRIRHIVPPNNNQAVQPPNVVGAHVHIHAQRNDAIRALIHNLPPRPYVPVHQLRRNPPQAHQRHMPQPQHNQHIQVEQDDIVFLEHLLGAPHGFH